VRSMAPFVASTRRCGLPETGSWPFLPNHPAALADSRCRWDVRKGQYKRGGGFGVLKGSTVDALYEFGGRDGTKPQSDPYTCDDGYPPPTLGTLTA